MTVAMLLFSNNLTQAVESSSDLNLSVGSVVSLSLTNCDSSNPDNITINLDPTNAGVFNSTCQNIAVAANTPGYSLYVKSSSTDLLYQNPTTINPAPIVPSTTTGTIAVPAVLPNDTWGFAIEKQVGMTSNFDTSYTVNNASNKYALLPTTDQTIYQTDKALGETPTPLSDFKAFYGAKLTLATVAGEYRTTITYTVIGADVPEPPPTTMQAMTIGYCINQMEIYEVKENGVRDESKLKVLIDTRDGQEYLVGKLADGNCWMLNNLKLGSTTSTMTLTPLDTNIDEDYILPQVQDFSTVDLSAAMVAYTSLSSTTDIWSSQFYGYYYNFCTVSLGKYCTGNSADVVAAITRDICPTGWRVPRQDEYGYINSYYSANINFNLRALRLNMSGYIYPYLSYIYPYPVPRYEARNTLWYDSSETSFGFNVLGEDEDGFVSGGSGGGGNQILLDGDDFGLSVRCLLNYEI